MNKKELEALVEERQATIEEQSQTIDAKQARIKELDEQVMSVQGILENVFQLGITTRAQRRQWVKAYEKWLYGRYGQAQSQLKIELNRLKYENMQLRELADEYIKTLSEITEVIKSSEAKDEMD
jgi:predicted metal-dependent hydrolase